MDDATEDTRLPANNAQTDPLFTGFPPYGSTLCPQCDYDLTGLPEAHSCPECGFAYDAFTRTWRVASDSRRASSFFYWIIMIGALTFVSLNVRRQITGGKIAVDISDIFVLVGYGLALFLWRPQLIIALGPSGIYRKRLLSRGQLISWNRVQSVIVQANVKSVELILLDCNRRTIFNSKLKDLFISQRDCETVLRHYADVPIASDVSL